MTGINALDCTNENIELHELPNVIETKVDESLLKVGFFTSDIDMTRRSSLDRTDENNIELHELASVNEIKVDESLLNISNEIDGHRIVDVAHIFFQIQNIKHDGGFGCNFIDMNFVREVRSGFYSDFVFECKMCGIEKKLVLRKTAQKIIGL
ncbi:uncharacterized protein LOC107884527 isoform X2 [Acyrthosiphon pisum]|uniref:Uncharacterized protein n=1 Tax=Acyrthosiphon pisum TaxID=7029 RepID=A0A8R2NRJ7_ACYPI|nr:uncharacterized protein LOC107884527 isoform X2 [Acyrthosiphon pisum]|eukprot:XP_016662313.1 PREDICTED: uncharacterized protein LOC107884527 [Acyrthosiphon pisum]